MKPFSESFAEAITKTVTRYVNTNFLLYTTSGNVRQAEIYPVTNE